ncbi:MAG: dCTP deaminase [Haloferacaceae archaeon]
MPAHALADRIEGLVHADTQVHGAGVDLTVAEVARVAEAGRIDFGGGELAAADLDPVETELRSPDDDYGWWNLDTGGYVVRFNERLTGAEPVRVEPRRELAARGGSLPTVTTADLDPLPLAVPTGTGDGPALRVKENARIATVRSV